MTKITARAALLGLAVALSSTASAGSFGSTNRLCLTVTVEEPAACEKDDQIVFAPDYWGNEQQPILVARFCDLNKAVVWNNSGLTSIAAGKRESIFASELLKQKQ